MFPLCRGSCVPPWAACCAHGAGGVLQAFLNGAGGLNSAPSGTPSSSVPVPFLYHILPSGLRVPKGAYPDLRVQLLELSGLENTFSTGAGGSFVGGLGGVKTLQCDGG